MLTTPKSNNYEIINNARRFTSRTFILKVNVITATLYVSYIKVYAIIKIINPKHSIIRDRIVWSTTKQDRNFLFLTTRNATVKDYN